MCDVSKGTMATAFNEWMRRYTDDPSRFKREWQHVSEYLAARAAGNEPTYGACCAAYLHQLLRDLQGVKDAAPPPPNTG